MILQVDKFIFLQRYWGKFLSVPRVILFDVFRQVTFVPEPFQACLEQTSEWFFTCMLSFVRFKLGLRKEAFTAVITKELEIPGMSPHMGQQIPSISKAFLALRTRKFSIIRNTRSSAPTIGISSPISFNAQRRMRTCVIDDIKRISPTQKARGLNRSIKAVMTSISGHNRLSKIGQVIQ